MICLKISTFVVSKTTFCFRGISFSLLWFAWKSVPLWYLKQPPRTLFVVIWVVICLKISTFVVSKTTPKRNRFHRCTLWFAWKSVPLWYLKQLGNGWGCVWLVVICLKISTFVVSKTTICVTIRRNTLLWFAWKSVPLWYLKQPQQERKQNLSSCDLLENQYLCGI